MRLHIIALMIIGVLFIGLVGVFVELGDADITNLSATRHKANGSVEISGKSTLANADVTVKKTGGKAEGKTDSEGNFHIAAARLLNANAGDELTVTVEKDGKKETAKVKVVNVKCGSKGSHLKLAALEFSSIQTPGDYAFTWGIEDVLFFSENATTPLNFGEETISPSFVSLSLNVSSEVINDLVWITVTDLVFVLSSVVAQSQPTGENVATLDLSRIEHNYGYWNLSSNAIVVQFFVRNTNDLLEERSLIMPSLAVFEGTYNPTTGVMNISGVGSFTVVGEVGGITIPVDFLLLLAPYVSSALILLAIAVSVVFYIKRKNNRK